MDRFSVILPIQDSESFIAKLEHKGIPIDAKEPKPSFGAVFIQLLPWVVLIGLWLFGRVAQVLILLFIGLELMAISTYILVGFLRRDRRSNEAALKYLLLGAFSSGIFAYGLSLLYGLAGSTNLQQISAALANATAPGRVQRGNRNGGHRHVLSSPERKWNAD